MRILKSRLQEKFNLLDIDELNVLNGIASDKNKQTCNDFIDSWREQGIVHGYFGAKCNEIYRRRRVTNNDILELYIYYCYVMFEEDVTQDEQDIFKYLANFYYRQGQYEAMKEPKDIPNKLYDELLDTPCTNGYTLDEYKGAIALQNTYRTHRYAVMDVQRGEKPKVNDKEMEKQQNERLKVGLKISGVIDMLLIGINNMAKVEGIKVATDDDGKVRFVAVRDDRTTKMCKSLDGQLFNIHKRNTFRRYSEQDKGMKTYNCEGLVLGLNLPPINNRLSLVSLDNSLQYRLPRRKVV